MIKINLNKISLLSKFFTKTILQNNDSSRKCYTITYPLSLHLENNGFGNLITKGFFNQTPHYWITLNEERNIIIDPTKNQFNKNEDIVYIGNKSDEYKFISDEETQPTLIEDVYEIWINPFVNNISIKEQMAILEINIKAAIFVHNEMIEKKIDINKSQKHLTYFRGIKDIFNNFCDIVNNFKDIDGFECLEIKLNDVVN